MAFRHPRSLTAVGERRRLTQPAVSHALRRLRILVDDQLFGRTKNPMAPIEAAAQLHGPLEEAFGIINRTLLLHGTFAPSTTERVFRVMMSDVAAFYDLLALLGQRADVAPAVRIEIVQPSASLVGAGTRASGW